MADIFDLEDGLEDFDLGAGASPSPAKVEKAEEEASPPTASVRIPDNADDLNAFLANSGLEQAPRQQGRVPQEDLIKPWMRFHTFVLVKTVEEVRALVDRAIKHGRCALDLETEGFDNRVEFTIDTKKVPVTFTRHKIVGYCLSVKGVGYYVPVRHKFNVDYKEKDPNVPVEQVDAEIRRLCLASQPVLTPEGLEEDPLASKRIATPPRVVIYFWNAKFDQEFLFPVTGIDFWHPESFEDGMLAAYVSYTDDPDLGLKGKALSNLSVVDPDKKDSYGQDISYPYEMIKFEDTFPKGMLRSDMKFANHYPEEGAPMVLYACSDAICTELLCETKRILIDFKVNPLKVKYDDVVSPVLKDKRYASTYRLEKMTVQAVRILERARAKIDVSSINGLIEEAQHELDSYLAKIRKLAESKGFPDFNPGSTEQLSVFLFDAKGLDINPKPPRNEASQQYKTDAATLEKMFEDNPEIEVLEWVVKYRQISKIIGTYLSNLKNNCDELGQLRFKFQQTGAATGRFTAPAGEPDHGYGGIPIQGIPARNDPKKPKVAHSLRRMFIAREGYTLVKVDYAGQELRIVSNLSKEPVWVKEFLEGTGDLHTITAQAFFGPHITKKDTIERNMGKIANFSLIYGGGSSAIMRATKCEKVEAARRKENFDRSVPRFAGWVTRQHDNVKRDLGVWTAFGRFIRIPDANLSGKELFKQSSEKKRARGEQFDEAKLLRDCEFEARRIRAGCERKATNFPIQGSGADILKISLVKLVKELFKRGWLRTNGDDSVRMIMTVHDEIVFEIKHERLAEALPVIIAVMESPAKLARWEIPLVVEPLIGLTWEAKNDWLAIVEGKEPVPAWLQPYVDVRNLPVVQLPVDSAPSPAPPMRSPVQDEVVDSPDLPAVRPSSPPAQSTRKHNKVVQFAIPMLLLSRNSIGSIRHAIVEATPLGMEDQGKSFKLKVVDQAGNLLVDPGLGIQVVPDKFRDALKRYNLGQGFFDFPEE